MTEPIYPMRHMVEDKIERYLYACHDIWMGDDRHYPFMRTEIANIYYNHECHQVAIDNDEEIPRNLCLKAVVADHFKDNESFYYDFILNHEIYLLMSDYSDPYKFVEVMKKGVKVFGTKLEFLIDHNCSVIYFRGLSDEDQEKHEKGIQLD